METGTNAEEPDFLRTWQAFKSFAHARIEQTHGFLLFECGQADFGEGYNHFNVHFLRNFYLEAEEEGWDDVMVNCDFKFDTADELDAFEFSVTVDTGAVPEPEGFITQVEAYQELWLALRGRVPRQSAICIGSQ